MAIQSINPTTGKIIKNFIPDSTQIVDQKLEKSHQAFLIWRSLTFAERAKLQLKLAQKIRKESLELAQIITKEMGKPLAQAKAEVEKCALVLEFYSQNTPNFLKPQVVKTDNKKSYVRFDPLGVILAVMPWNFPFWQVFRASAPALMAGNTMILKHASNVPKCALLIEKLYHDSGYPIGVFTTLLIEGSDTNRIISNKNIAAITLTGSEKAGRMVSQTAGFNLKKTVLELGGSDPFIVLADADLENATNIAVTARTQNAGQSCIAAKRFILMPQIAEKFTKLFVEKMKKLNVGDPLKPETQVGPLAKLDILETIKKQVNKSVSLGAKILTGGKRISAKGYFFEPTIITNLKPGMPCYNEEVFGPVASIFVVKNVDEALKLANSTSFGLGASIWTKNVALAEKLAVKIDSGFVAINDMVKSNPNLPFGGIKNSGYGRELGSYGIREFVNIKTVVVK